MRPFRQVTTKALISNSNCNVFASPVRVSHYLKCTFLHTENPFQKFAYILCCGCSLLAVSSFNGFGIGAHINGFVCRQFVQFSIPIQALGRKARTFGVHAQYDFTPFAQCALVYNLFENPLKTVECFAFCTIPCSPGTIVSSSNDINGNCFGLFRVWKTFVSLYTNSLGLFHRSFVALANGFLVQHLLNWFFRAQHNNHSTKIQSVVTH